jgi:hypothetical protein
VERRRVVACARERAGKGQVSTTGGNIEDEVDDGDGDANNEGDGFLCFV